MLQCKSAAGLALLVAISVGCDRQSPSASPTSKPSTQPVAENGTIVSLSPAATDLLLAIGAGDRLAGVSTYDSDSRVVTLPRVGDYENVDWERIATIAPKQMIVQMAPERVPTGFRERAAKLGIVLYNSHIDRLDDISREAAGLGAAVGRPEAAKAFVEQLNASIASVNKHIAGMPRVRTLLCVSDDGLGVAGRDTYLDDLLVAAGGENALPTSSGSYVKLDREALLTLAPDAIIQLTPSPTAAQREQNKLRWTFFDAMPAVKNGRVLVIDAPWCLTPGAHVGDLATRFAAFLHPPSPAR